MKAIEKKLNSQTGASITFALLLFLVCAVVGAAVLTAGTVVAGRMSQTAEADQRYYSVNSAARSLAEAIENETVTVVKTVTTEGGVESTVYTCSIEGEAAPFAQNQSSVLAFPSIPAEAAYYLAGSPSVNPRISQLSMTAAAEGGKDFSALAVDITETLDADGKMILSIQNAPGSGKYVLELCFEPDSSVRTDRTGEHETATTLRVCWHLTDIRTPGSGRRGGTA